MKRSIEELKVWIEGQMRRYAKGLLNAKQIADLESIPGWTWTPSVQRVIQKGGRRSEDHRTGL